MPNQLPRTPLPPPRPASSADLLPAGLPPQNYASAFLETVGATLERPAIVRDVIGERMVVGADLFKDTAG